MSLTVVKFGIRYVEEQSGTKVNRQKRKKKLKNEMFVPQINSTISDRYTEKLKKKTK